MSIKYCPNCKGNLKDKVNLAQHVKECGDCKARYFTIETTSPEIEVKSKWDKLNAQFEEKLNSLTDAQWDEWKQKRDSKNDKGRNTTGQ